MSMNEGESYKPAGATGGGWMKVSRPHKALPQVPPPKDQPQSSPRKDSSTTPTESPPQSISSVPVPETTPVGSPTTNISATPPTAKWRAVKVPDQATYRPLVSSSDSNSSANGTEPTNTPPSNDTSRSQRATVIIMNSISNRN